MYFCSSEEELPTPTALEEKVGTFFTAHVIHFCPLTHALSTYDVLCFAFSAKATGVGASGEMAEDGEEMGQIQEQ